MTLNTPNKSLQHLQALSPHIAGRFQYLLKAAIAPQPIPFDLIVQETGLTTGEVSSALLQLELLGLVSQLPGMRYQLHLS